MMHDLWQELKIKGEYPPEGETIKEYLFPGGGYRPGGQGRASVSGDSYAVLPMKGGRQALLLSDGMEVEGSPTGQLAVRLMERLLSPASSRKLLSIQLIRFCACATR